MSSIQKPTQNYDRGHGRQLTAHRAAGALEQEGQARLGQQVAAVVGRGAIHADAHVHARVKQLAHWRNACAGHIRRSQNPDPKANINPSLQYAGNSRLLTMHGFVNISHATLQQKKFLAVVEGTAGLS